MKKLILVATMVGVSMNIYAQGTIDFRNSVGSAPTYTVRAPVGNPSGTPIGDTNFVAQLYFGQPTDADTSLTAVVDLPAPFRAGTGAGFWNPGNTVRTLIGIAGGVNARIQVRVWNGTVFGPTGYAAAVAAGAENGASTSFTMLTGGGGAPPGPAAFMTSLTAFNTTIIPEPSTIALGVLGVVFFLMRKRM